jgi:heme exporter protein C
MHGKHLRTLTLATLVTLTGGFAVAAFVAPMDADQGLIQKIFYLHVPMAIVALGGFVYGGICGAMHLRTGKANWDLRSYCALHHALILALGVLVTGAIWGKASWGQWWVWEEPTLVAFLIIFLLYVTYSPLRFAIEDRERQARYASVFAVVGAVFVPLNFMAVRMATALIHPRTFDSTDNLPGSMAIAFLICTIGMTLLFVTLVQYEMTQKNTTFQLRALRRRLGDDVVVGRSAAPDLSQETT